MKKILLLIVLIIVTVTIMAQYDSLWAYTYGDTTKAEIFRTIVETHANNYLIGGYISNGALGGEDGWIVNIDRNGDTLNAIYVGGADDDEIESSCITPDMKYLFAGLTKSWSGGPADAWLIKTDENGDTLWTRRYGGDKGDKFFGVKAISDTTYIMVGYRYTDSNGADVYIVMTDSIGDTVWTRTIGWTGDDALRNVIKVSETEYMGIGVFQSPGLGNMDGWLVKFNDQGDTLWTKTFGGVSYDEMYDLCLTSDGCILCVGANKSYTGTDDAWIIKCNLDGDTLWTRVIENDSGDELLMDIIPVPDNEYICGGITDSEGAGDYDGRFIKIDEDGNILWTATCGGPDLDRFANIVYTYDDAYIMVGKTNSFTSLNSNGYVVSFRDMMPHKFDINGSSINYYSDYIPISWNIPSCHDSIFFECTIGSVKDTVASYITEDTLSTQDDGTYEWYVTAVNTYGFRRESNTRDTVYIDAQGPAMLAIEEIPDTNFIGPYMLRMMAEDTVTGIDSIAIKYMLPGDTIWSSVLTTEKAGLWYTGYIPAVTQTGFVYYHVMLYDGAVPANASRYPSYPGLYSFRVTGLTGIDDEQTDYRITYTQLDNTSIELLLPNESPVNIALYDVNGRSVMNRSLFMPLGVNRINLDIIPGVYFVHINTPYGNTKGKLVKIK